MERIAVFILVSMVVGGAYASTGEKEVGIVDREGRQRGAANKLAAAAYRHGGARRLLTLPCDTLWLASHLTCVREGVGADCCHVVLTTVDLDHCLCAVGEDPVFRDLSVSIPQMWYWYTSCGGHHTPKNDDDHQCRSDTRPRPRPRPPPPPPPPPPPAAKPDWLVWTAVGVLATAGVVIILSLVVDTIRYLHSSVQVARDVSEWHLELTQEGACRDESGQLELATEEAEPHPHRQSMAPYPRLATEVVHPRLELTTEVAHPQLELATEVAHPQLWAREAPPHRQSMAAHPRLATEEAHPRLGEAQPHRQIGGSVTAELKACSWGAWIVGGWAGGWLRSAAQRKPKGVADQGGKTAF